LDPDASGSAGRTGIGLGHAARLSFKLPAQNVAKAAVGFVIRVEEALTVEMVARLSRIIGVHRSWNARHWNEIDRLLRGFNLVAR
jgi:hypothetical protein